MKSPQCEVGGRGSGDTGERGRHSEYLLSKRKRLWLEVSGSVDCFL